MLSLCWLAFAPGHAVEAAELAATTVPHTPAPVAISVGEIATRAAELPGLLRSLTPRPSGQILGIEKQLPEMRERIDAELVAADSILRGEPPLRP
jgi:hypothetical protein